MNQCMGVCPLEHSLCGDWCQAKRKRLEAQSCHSLTQTQDAWSLEPKLINSLSLSLPKSLSLSLFQSLPLPYFLSHSLPLSLSLSPHFLSSIPLSIKTKAIYYQTEWDAKVWFIHAGPRQLWVSVLPGSVVGCSGEAAKGYTTFSPNTAAGSGMGLCVFCPESFQNYVSLIRVAWVHYCIIKWNLQ